MNVRPMSIHDCEHEAKEDGFDSMRFLAIFPAGPKHCRWLDAHMGAFKVEGMDGFVTVKQIAEMFPNLICIPQPQGENE